MATITLDAGSIYRVLRFGTPEQRLELGRALPPDPMRDMALGLLGSDSPGMALVALGPVTISYCNGSQPGVGAELARGLHRLAFELYEGSPDHAGLIPTTLSSLADNYVKACNQLGRSEDAILFADQWISFYEEIEPINVRSLKLGRIEALLNLNFLDDADMALQDETLPGNPPTDIELARLQGRMRQLRTSITEDRSRGPAPAGPVGDDFVARAQAAMRGLVSGMPDETRMRELIDKLADAPRLNPNDPEGFKQLNDLLNQGEKFMRRGGAGDSQLSIRGRIRNATAIFATQQRPPADALEKSLAELEICLAWADENGVVELQNDALWGIYLCHSRLDHPSESADAALRLRANLEAARSAIGDEKERGGAFAQYPYLFAALCEKLYKAQRIPEMLEAIEASKGRGVADLLTKRGDAVVADDSIYGAVRRLAELCQEHKFHYLTYFVDDEQTYAVLVTSDGEMHAPAPVPISRAAVRSAATPVTPQSVTQLSPLVAWLDEYIDDGHLCIAADDDLANVPFACLSVGGKPLIETFSCSRIQNAFHLAHLLERRAQRPKQHLGVIVPSRDNVAHQRWAEMQASLQRPIAKLTAITEGDELEGKMVTVDAVAKRPLNERAIHFSTHGVFPVNDPSSAPFEFSGLVLADGKSLPSLQPVNYATTLTPRAILDRRLDLTGSHVSMMACVSGLSREGAGGDALGMEWALVQAGAASVLSTHWNVSASAAADYLERFYDFWLKKKRSRAESFRMTIAELRTAGAPVSSWAAFSLTGDWR